MQRKFKMCRFANILRLQFLWSSENARLKRPSAFAEALAEEQESYIISFAFNGHKGTKNVIEPKILEKKRMYPSLAKREIAKE